MKGVAIVLFSGSTLKTCNFGAVGKRTNRTVTTVNVIMVYPCLVAILLEILAQEASTTFAFLSFISSRCSYCKG
jgi:hypothetical protein